MTTSKEERAKRNEFVQRALSGELAPARPLDDVRNAEVEWVERGEGTLPPAVFFRWNKLYRMDGFTVKQVRALRNAGFIFDRIDGDLPEHTYGIEQEGHFLALYNHERRAWCWTTSAGAVPSGVYYEGDLALPIHFMAATQEQVIRDCLVTAWTALLCGNLIPHWFNTFEVSAILRDLYEDAVEHAPSDLKGWEERSRRMWADRTPADRVAVRRDAAWKARFPMPESNPRQPSFQDVVEG